MGSQLRKRKTKSYAEQARLYDDAVEVKVNPRGKVYPVGTLFNKWVLFYDSEEQKDGSVKSIPRIRRWVIYPDGEKKFERYPAEVWEDIRNDDGKLRKFVMRANGLDPNEVRARRKYELKEAYVGKELMDDYIRELRNEIPKYKKVKDQIQLLERYFLGFFVQKMGIVEPLEWHRNQVYWGLSLINLPNDPASDDYDPNFKEDWRLFPVGENRSPKTLKSIVQAANRFMRFLHKQRPREIPPLEFDPVSRARLNTIKAIRDHKGLTLVRYKIPDAHWKCIVDKCPPEIKAWVLICYNYGLRRSEAMAITTKNILNKKLVVREQLEALPVPDQPRFAVLKGKDARRVRHWFMSAQELHDLLKIQPKFMCPTGFTKAWGELMDLLGYPYGIHDLRHTWVTRAVRVPGVHARDVQQAAGHKHLTTTMAYMQRDDEEDGDDAPFVPDEE